MSTFQTRATLAGAYRGKRLNLKALLTHTVEVSPTGHDVRVLCSGVKLESICDEFGSETDLAPTCPSCVKKDSRFPV